MRPIPSLLLLAACASGDPATDAASSAQPLQVVALSHPAGWLAGTLIGDAGQVTVMLPNDADAAHWRPSPEAIAALADKDLLVANGADHEPWIATGHLPRRRLVVSAKNLDLIVREDGGVTHAHGGHAHHHSATDPTTWLDPLLFQGQAGAVHRALRTFDPGSAEVWDHQYEAVRAWTNEAHQRLQEATEGLAERPVAVTDRTWSYLARRYGLPLTVFDLDPTAIPDPERLAAVTAWAQAHAEPTLWWSSPPDPSVAAALPASIAQRVLDPIDRPIDGVYDWTARIHALATALDALTPEVAAPSQPSAPTP